MKENTDNRIELMQIELGNCSFTLLPEKALYKTDESLLVIADIHLGKASHFRKNGVPISAGSQKADFQNLEALFEKIKPEKVYFLGDLFHSTINNDWIFFEELICRYSQIRFTLIKGNHDIIKKEHFDKCGVTIVKDQVEDGCFIYSHEPLKENSTGKLNIAGHIHPGIALGGLGRQYVKLPCFYHSGNLLLLPAFGYLTGLYMVDYKKTDNIYIVTPGGVKAIQL